MSCFLSSSRLVFAVSPGRHEWNKNRLFALWDSNTAETSHSLNCGLWKTQTKPPWRWIRRLKLEMSSGRPQPNLPDLIARWTLGLYNIPVRWYTQYRCWYTSYRKQWQSKLHTHSFQQRELPLCHGNVQMIKMSTFATTPLVTAHFWRGTKRIQPELLATWLCLSSEQSKK